VTPKPQPRSNARSIISLRVIESKRNETKRTAVHRTAPHRRSEAKQNRLRQTRNRCRNRSRNRKTETEALCVTMCPTHSYVPYQEVVGGALARPKGLGNLTPQMSTDRSTSSIWVYRPVRRQTDSVQLSFNVCVCMCARVHVRACAVRACVVFCFVGSAFLHEIGFQAIVGGYSAG
jgi:hypothetical protein